MSLSPSLLIAAAGALVESAATTADCSRLAEKCLLGTGGFWTQRWSAAFVHHVGFWSHFDYAAGRSLWPLPATADCDELAAFARNRGVLSSRLPEPGDVFLVWSAAQGRFVHTGFVLAAARFSPLRGNPTRYACHTIEGNVTSAGSIGGGRLARVQRILSPVRGDRTIRWKQLDTAPMTVQLRVSA